MGESEGEPRNVSSPDIFTENFSAAVDYLGLQSFVDREKIGVIGICGSGGFALSAAQMDTRIKAVATASMYDMTVAGRSSMDKDTILKTKEKLSNQRWIDAENGYPEYIPYFPEKPLDEVPAQLEEPTAEWFRFYALRRGHHTNARGGFTSTSDLAFLNYRLLDYIDEISPRPILFIIGDRAHSKFFSEEALTEKVTNSYKAFLRKLVISYIIVGKEKIDYEVLLLKLKKLFGINNVMLGGVGILNWSLLQAGLCDEVSIVIAAAADGSTKTPTLFMAKEEITDDTAICFSLKSAEVVDDDVLWVRYSVKDKK